MRVTRYVSAKALRELRENKKINSRDLEPDRGDYYPNEITIIIPDEPIEVTVWKSGECNCLFQPINCATRETCTKYTGTLNPVTP